MWWQHRTELDVEMEGRNFRPSSGINGNECESKKKVKKWGSCCLCIIIIPL
jgi:hypothetical protein